MMSAIQPTAKRLLIQQLFRLLPYVLIGATVLYSVAQAVLASFHLTLRLNPIAVAMLFGLAVLLLIIVQWTIARRSAAWRRLGAVLLVLLWIFLAAILLFFQWVSIHEWGNQKTETMRLSDGRMFVLVHGTDFIDGAPRVTLFRKVRMFPLVWAFVPGRNELTQPGLYGGYSRNPRLTLSPDQRYLLVSRGGVWSDCIDLSRDHRVCEGLELQLPQIGQEDPDAKMMADRSRVIERLVGLTPPQSDLE